MTIHRKLAACLAVASAFAFVAPAQAASPVLTVASPLGMTCSAKTSTDTKPISYQFCTGLVPSFDGVPLDVDVTLPAGATTALPTLVMLHGWGNNKGDWEKPAAGGSGDTGNYNNVSFASRGYAVVNYTARGFGGSCGVSAMPWSQVCATQGWTHLADRRYEIHDTHYLIGQLVDAGIADPKHIGVTGGSYGGGQSWLLALEGDRDTVTDSTGSKLVPWKSPKGKAIHLAVSVPKYPWTDLVDALVPNGQASDGVIQKDASRDVPYGFDKESFVDGLFALGMASGHYAPPGVDNTADLISQFAAIQAGEPGYNPANPILTNALFQLETWKSAYYQDDLIRADKKAKDEVPVLSIQGFTDQLFTESQTISMDNKLRAVDPKWPLSAYFGDVGHQPANNKDADWADLNAAANAFIDYYMKGAGPRPANKYWARATTCDKTVGATYSASTWNGIARKRTVLKDATSQQTVWLPTNQPTGIKADPIVTGNACMGFATGTFTVPNSAVEWKWKMAKDTTLLGQPVLSTAINMTGVDGQVSVRLWDRDAIGTETLVSRSDFRVTTQGASIANIVLTGNGWKFLKGHYVVVEIVQADFPYVRFDNLPSSITYSSVNLTLPTV